MCFSWCFRDTPQTQSIIAFASGPHSTYLFLWPLPFGGSPVLYSMSDTHDHGWLRHFVPQRFRSSCFWLGHTRTHPIGRRTDSFGHPMICSSMNSKKRCSQQARGRTLCCQHVCGVRFFTFTVSYRRSLLLACLPLHVSPGERPTR